MMQELHTMTDYFLLYHCDIIACYMCCNWKKLPYDVHPLKTQISLHIPAVRSVFVDHIKKIYIFVIQNAQADLNLWRTYMSDFLMLRIMYHTIFTLNIETDSPDLIRIYTICHSSSSVYCQEFSFLNTDNPLCTDTRYNGKIRYNDNFTVTKPLLKR